MLFIREYNKKKEGTTDATNRKQLKRQIVKNKK